ncbi:MAG: LemA family protein [Crocinitomicaceae bacterium]|jgi:LemA protein|nr:LemA family protein [Crocinitomicaceae bacterium]
MNTKGLLKWWPLMLVALLFFHGCSTYNSLVKKEEGVTAQWQQVEVQYQARMDKTENLLEIVKRAADFEKSTLSEVVEARAKATSIQLNVDELTEENLEKFQAAQESFGRSLGRLMAVAENYPNLKSVEAFRDFQAQYEGMENRIAVERYRFNEICQKYNTSIRRFPSNVYAQMFGFDKKAYFKSSEGAEKAPSIKDM